MIEPLVLCWAHPGTVSGRFMDSVLRLVLASQTAVAQGIRPDHVVAGYNYVEGGPRIASARNRLVREFLNNPRYRDVEWLLMLDADMVFDETLLPTLFDGVRDVDGALVRPIVGGLCIGGGHATAFPTMYEIVDPKTNDGEPVRTITNFRVGDVVRVDATGAACLLVHRSVYEAMAGAFPEPVPWFAESIYLGREFGEDWTFCLRAGRLGYPIVVNTNAQVGHMKPMMMTVETWRDSKPVATPEPPLATVTQLNREKRRHPERAQRR